MGAGNISSTLHGDRRISALPPKAGIVRHFVDVHLDRLVCWSGLHRYAGQGLLEVFIQSVYDMLLGDSKALARRKRKRPSLPDSLPRRR